MSSPRLIALCDRAYEALGSCEPLDEETLLAHVYGGVPPPAVRPQLLQPLLNDPRLERDANGSWFRRGAADSHADELTVLALATTGPTPGRGRIVHISALHVSGETVVRRFSTTVRPERRVPGYVSTRLHLDPAVLNDLQPLDTLWESLKRFLAARPVVAQDALLTWAFVDAEARARDDLLAPPYLIDVNELAEAAVEALPGKPTLARLAQHFGFAFGHIEHPDEETRVLVQVVPPLLRQARSRGLSVLGQVPAVAGRAVLRRGGTAQALPDQPGVYVLRARDDSALYVGKARRLRSRMASYVHRPLGATRRLEGLVGAVEGVDSSVCETDLEALVLEDREIRRLQPRFNTVRHQREPRTWLRLPPLPGPRRAPRRLALTSSPGADGEFVGPFRNEATAEAARRLAREVFELDELRRRDPFTYEARLKLAWDFLRLNGRGDTAIALLQERARAAVASGETELRRRLERLLTAVSGFHMSALLLPADPRTARYAVIRPGPSGIEGFLLDAAVLVQYAVVSEDGDVDRFARTLLQPGRARTSPADAPVVLRWLGAQRASAYLIPVTDTAAEAIEDAAQTLLDARSSPLPR